ncbi:head decoration protein [Rhodoligotrophos ferricapiens]|uniref:head decoration protein n=1 Tax=Rhodoligotrophos ferricapiens TaxID=3069264 RepID=UPI00315D9E03
MAYQTLSYKVDSDVVKTEGKNRYSRDEVILASGSPALEVGTVLGMVTTTGKYEQLDPAASDGTQTARAILLEKTPALSADRRVVVLARAAEVVSQALIWPAGINATQKATALASLDGRGIVARNGV